MEAVALLAFNPLGLSLSLPQDRVRRPFLSCASARDALSDIAAPALQSLRLQRTRHLPSCGGAGPSGLHHLVASLSLSVGARVSVADGAFARPTDEGHPFGCPSGVEHACPSARLSRASADSQRSNRPFGLLPPRGGGAALLGLRGLRVSGENRSALWLRHSRFAVRRLSGLPTSPHYRGALQPLSRGRHRPTTELLL